jgi:tryptophan synthase alpha chain
LSDGERRIAAAFDAARSEGRAALMPYVMGCFPDDRTASAVAHAYAEAGADMVEVGVPFSDPLADGPVIHAAATRALADGASFERSIALCDALGDGVPSIVMCYANMVQAMGAKRFAGRLADAGAAGAIVPDLPLEEAGETRDALAEQGLALAPLVAPTTPDARRREICASARGFVYVVSLVGVTGERESLPAGLEANVAAARADAEVPVAVGFGISTPSQVAEVGRIADGVIVASRLVREVGDATDADSAARVVGAFVSDARAEMSAAR